MLAIYYADFCYRNFLKKLIQRGLEEAIEQLSIFLEVVVLGKFEFPFEQDFN